MRHLNRNILVLRILCLISLGMLVSWGCRARVHTDILSKSFSPGPALLGYTIQTGAFSIVGNAIRMTAALNQQGYDAFYFVHESGLFKVRMGNYSTRKKRILERKGCWIKMSSVIILSSRQENILQREVKLGMNVHSGRVWCLQPGILSAIPIPGGARHPKKVLTAAGLLWPCTI